MASHFSPTTSVSNPSIPNNLTHFGGCQYSFIAATNGIDPNGNQTIVSPRLCRLRTRDNIMGIYAIADPIGTDMLASNISVNSLIEKLSEISFNDDLYKERIESVMQNISFEIENRLLQLTFDHAEEKVVQVTSSVDRAEKVLPALDEARSAAFLCAATVTQSSIFLAFVGTIRLFIISKGDKGLFIDDKGVQFYRNTSLHTFDNENEIRRLKELNVDVHQSKYEHIDRNHSNYTRCIGKLAEKLLSATGSTGNVNDARCNTLICEATVQEIEISPLYYAMIMMTDNFYQTYVKTVASENALPADLVDIFERAVKTDDVAETMLKELDERFQERFPNNSRQSFGLLVHFFHRPINNPMYSLPIPTNLATRPMANEVTIAEVTQFVLKNQDLQEKRHSKYVIPSNQARHERENQEQHGFKNTFVTFESYSQALNDNPKLSEATNLITDLLYTQPVSELDKQLDEFLRQNPSLMDD